MASDEARDCLFVWVWFGRCVKMSFSLSLSHSLSLSLSLSLSIMSDHDNLLLSVASRQLTSLQWQQHIEQDPVHGFTMEQRLRGKQSCCGKWGR